MPTLASDDFDRADANPIGSPWVTITGNNALKILSNECRGTVSSDNNAAYFDGGVTWPDDQWSECTISSQSNDVNGPVVRASTGAQSLYYLVGDGSPGAGMLIRKFVAGVNTLLGSAGNGWVVGDVAYLEAQGTTLVGKKNAVSTVTVTDSSLSSGKPGLYSFSQFNGMDDWSAGDFAAGGVTGSSDVTLDALTVSAAGALALAGQVATTLADATLAAAGTVALQGAAAVTLDAVTASATGSVGAQGTAAITLADATVASAGAIALAGQAAVTLADATVTGAGAVALTGTATIALDAATVAAEGEFGSIVTGEAAVTLADATAAAVGTVALRGAASIALEAATLSSAGQALLAGSATVALDACTIVATGISGDAFTGLADITLADCVAGAGGWSQVLSAPPFGRRLYTSRRPSQLNRRTR